MHDDRIPTHLWVAAHLRRCIADGIPAVLVRRGAAESGSVLVKINRRDHGCTVLSQTRDFDGRLGWLAAFDGTAVAENEADSYIARAVARDPDLWVVEIEDRDGRHPFDGRIF